MPDVLRQWLDLLDAAHRLAQDDRSYVRPGASVVGRALDALHAYEHTLTDRERMQAHEALWQRDFPAMPLPSDRAWWALCQCRACRLARLDTRKAVYDVQLAALTTQRRRSS